MTLLLVMGIAAPVAASEEPAYVIAAWEMPAWEGDRTPTWPQSLVQSRLTDSRDLGQLDGQLQCGKYYQIDLYNNDETTRALLAGGVLNSPKDPPQSFPSPKGWDVTFKLVQTDPCEQEPPQLDPCDAGDRPAGSSIAEWIGDADCIDIEVTDVCGELRGSVTRQPDGLPSDYELRYAVGATVPDAPDGAGELPVSFSEDHNGGSVAVTYYLVGPEKDYVLNQDDLPNWWERDGETVTVDTDCVDTPSAPPPPPTPPSPVPPPPPLPDELTATAVGDCETETILVTISDGATGMVEIVTDGGFFVTRDVVDGEGTVEGLELGNTYPVTVMDADGEVLFEDEVTIPDDCEEVDSVVVEPSPPPVEPEPELPTVVDEVVIENPAPQPVLDNPAPQPVLAASGLGTSSLLALGALLVLSGVPMLRVGRRRTG